MTVKGDLKLEIDEQGIEVRITITPAESGGEISPDSIKAVLAEKKVRAGIDPEAIDKAFRTLARKKTEPVSFVAASGVAPLPPTPETVLFEALPIPSRLAAVAAKALAAAPAPKGFRLREEKVKTEKKVQKKAALPFLPAKQATEVVVEKRLVREEAPIDPAVMDTGFVTKGGLVARIKPGKQGKEGRSVFARLVPAPRPGENGFLFCDGLERAGTDVKAEVSGFLRRGRNWCDVVAFRDHLLEVAASPDGLTCLLTFAPGDAAAPEPDVAEIVAQAQKLGFGPESLLPQKEIEALLKDAALRKAPLAKKPITPAVDGVAAVTVSADKLAAKLSLRKGRGGGKPLNPMAATDAIRASKVKGFAADAVKKDLLAFFAGPQTELTDYKLAEGRPPKQGTDAKITWKALFLPAEEADVLRAAGVAGAERLSGLTSLAAFPLEKVDAVARVKPDAEILTIAPAQGSENGFDVYGAAIPAGRGSMPEIRLYEGVALRKDAVISTAAGLLEKGSDGMAILLRVRPHKDATFRASLSPDRMKGLLSFSPAEGGGASIQAQDVRSLMTQAGIKRGIDEDKLLHALDCVARGEALVDYVVAEGKKPAAELQKRIVFHVRVATGKAVALRKDGTADYRSQDRITRVRKAEMIATVRPRDPQAEDGWDVSGTVIPLPPEAQETLQAGAGVSEEVQPDGSVRFVAAAAGELRRDGPVLSVAEVHAVDGDVDMSNGNIKFPGNVRVTGSVRSGFSVIAEGLLEVEESVEAALLSSGGSIVIGQGVKGEGKAIIRARRDIEAPFAEQAVLLAMGNVHLHGPCMRCQVKCNGRLILDSEKGSLLGGEVRATRGASVQNIGSPGGTRTVVYFGQDYLVKDQIERGDNEILALTQQVAELDVAMLRLQKLLAGGASQAHTAALGQARARKLTVMKLMEQRKLRLIGLRDKFDEHIPATVEVRGTLYPGAILESHGRRYETRVEKRMITLHFDAVAGKIVEKT